MMRCYSCDCELTPENSSEEHIFPNALGGRLKSRILCRKCNNEYGEKCDAELVKSLSMITHFINPKRDNGTTPPHKFQMNGIEVIKKPASLDYYGLDIKVLPTDKGLDFHYTAIGERGKKKLLNEHKKHLQNFGRKHGWTQERLDTEINDFIAKLNTCEETIHNPLMSSSCNMGGPLVYQSCLKTVLNFYVHTGHNVAYVKNAIDILKSQSSDILQTVAMYYAADFFPNDMIILGIYLRGDTRNKKLFCLVSFYNICQVFVMLNDDYDGEAFEEQYYYDVWNGEKVNLTKHAIFSDEQIKEIFSKSDENFKRTTEIMKFHFDNVLQHFVVSEERIQNATKLLSDVVLNTINQLAGLSDTLSQQEFGETLIEKLPSIPKEANFLKTKWLHENLIENVANLYSLYLGQRAYYLFSKEMARILAKIFIDAIIRDKIDLRKQNMEVIKQPLVEFIRNFKFSDERFSVYLPELQEHLITTVDDFLQHIIKSIYGACRA